LHLLDTDVRGTIHVREAGGTILIGSSGCTLVPSAGSNTHPVENSVRNRPRCGSSRTVPATPGVPREHKDPTGFGNRAGGGMRLQCAHLG
jgi:hypothetical protein